MTPCMWKLPPVRAANAMFCSCNVRFGLVILQFSSVQFRTRAVLFQGTWFISVFDKHTIMLCLLFFLSLCICIPHSVRNFILSAHFLWYMYCQQYFNMKLFSFRLVATWFRYFGVVKLIPIFQVRPRLPQSLLFVCACNWCQIFLAASQLCLRCALHSAIYMEVGWKGGRRNTLMWPFKLSASAEEKRK